MSNQDEKKIKELKQLQSRVRANTSDVKRQIEDIKQELLVNENLRNNKQ